MPDAPVPHIYDVPFPKTHLLYFDVYRDKLCQLIVQYLEQVDRARAEGEPDDVPGKHAFVLGIHGPWGSGKSTLMRMVGRRVEQRVAKARSKSATKGARRGKNGPRKAEPILRVKFQAWRYTQREALWRALLSCLVGEIGELLRRRLPEIVGDPDEITSFEERRRAGERAARRDQRELAGSLDLCDEIEEALYRDYEVSRAEAARSAALGGFMVDAGEASLTKIAEDVDDLRRRRAREYHQRLRDLDRLQERFARLREASRHKWLIEIDDLDRCLPEEAIELFEATKIFLDVAGVVFVVALDRETIRRGLQLRYRERTGELPLVDPDLYIEKVTNISFVLPNLSDPANVKQLIREADSSRMDGFDDDAQKQDVERQMIALLEHQDRHVHPNPRRWIRLLNTALLYSRMRKPLEIELLRHGFWRRLHKLRLPEDERERLTPEQIEEIETQIEETVRDLPALLGEKASLEKLRREDRYRLWTLLQNLRSVDDWKEGRPEIPQASAWESEAADRTFLKVLCLSYRWGGFMEAALNSWEVMVTFEQAASQAERSFERFRDLCTARYPALRAYAEDPDLFQVLLSKPRIGHPKPPDFILEMF